jgi:hypothetical protein
VTKSLALKNSIFGIFGFGFFPRKLVHGHFWLWLNLFFAGSPKLWYFKRRWKWHRRSFRYETEPICSKKMYMKSDVTAIDHSSRESLKSMIVTVEIWADLVKAHSEKEICNETQKSKKRVWKRFFNRMWDHCPHFICFIRWDSSSVLLSEN